MKLTKYGKSIENVLSDNFGLDNIASSDIEDLHILMEHIKENHLFFVDQPRRSILDVGAGDTGTPFVNVFTETVPGTSAYYLEVVPWIYKKLKRSRKFLGDAAEMPFEDKTFDIVYVYPSDGISKEIPIWSEGKRVPTFEYFVEAHRILKPKGMTIFWSSDHGTSKKQDSNTKKYLKEIGFGKPTHLYRSYNWWPENEDYRRIPAINVYFAAKL